MKSQPMARSFAIKTVARAGRNIQRTRVACVGLFLLAGCSDAGTPSALRGPANGIIDVDAGSIPLGEGGTSAGGRTGGSSARGGADVGVSGGSMGGSIGATLPPTRGISTPCALDADCASSLSCRFDSADYIADQQCTKTCESNEECASTSDKDSFCIGARICVHACKSDADCLAKTHCNDSGWCERGGPGSGVPYCAGTPTSCFLLSDLQCIGSRGCTNDAKCSGVASSCYSQFDSYSCSRIHGCYWSSSSKDCSGSARSCSSHFGSSTCADQPGCSWSGGCTGVADSCESQFLSLCSEQPGCRLRTD